MAKQAAPTTATVVPGIYEIQYLSQNVLLLVLDEQSADGPIHGISITRRARLNARWLKPVGIDITPDHAEVLKLFAQFWPVD
jgi:hypothetical protein